VLLLGPFYVLILFTKNNYLYFCLHFLVLNLRGVCLALMLDNKPKSVFLSMTERWFILFFLNFFFNDKERIFGVSIDENLMKKDILYFCYATWSPKELHAHKFPFKLLYVQLPKELL
jgi:hypothetical protein